MFESLFVLQSRVMFRTLLMYYFRQLTKEVRTFKMANLRLSHDIHNTTEFKSCLVLKSLPTFRYLPKFRCLPEFRSCLMFRSIIPLTSSTAFKYIIFVLIRISVRSSSARNVFCVFILILLRSYLAFKFLLAFKSS
jgi:hypothetical protein